MENLVNQRMLELGQGPVTKSLTSSYINSNKLIQYKFNT